MPSDQPPVEAVVFDLGGVLIDWNPRHLYRTLFPGDDEAMERFLAEICTPAWNAQLDAGRPWPAAIEELTARHPESRELIAAYRERWEEMLGGPIEASVAILDELVEAGVTTYALTNWSAETFPIARARYPFLARFRGIVVSGELGIIKPDPRIFLHLMDTFDLRPEATVFIDDSGVNVDAAREVGLRAIRFRDPAGLRRELRSQGLPVAAAPDVQEGAA
jgi:2-haloacid dehalogenase